MIDKWWFWFWITFELAIMFWLMVWVRYMAYRHGIWDGAFNHFLPVVRKEMLFYDEHRAKAIFEREAALSNPPVDEDEDNGSVRPDR
jgi:hypothetical protein